MAEYEVDLYRHTPTRQLKHTCFVFEVNDDYDAMDIAAYFAWQERCRRARRQFEGRVGFTLYRTEGRLYNLVSQGIA